jgi:AcrR family transcriptional regulator
MRPAAFSDVIALPARVGDGRKRVFAGRCLVAPPAGRTWPHNIWRTRDWPGRMVERLRYLDSTCLPLDGNNRARASAVFADVSVVSMAHARVVTSSDKVLVATAELLRTGGVDAVSTRAVAAKAGVQPPVIYRSFGDKDGLLDAVTLFVLDDYLHQKRRLLRSSTDAISELRQLWDLHVQFGLANPDCYALTYGQARQGRRVTAASKSVALLSEAITRAAEQGLLKVPVSRATALMHSCGVGFVLTQIAIPEDERDPELSAISRENVISAITVESKSAGHKASARIDPAALAVALREALRGSHNRTLSTAERGMLSEWLDRIAGA